MKHMSSNFSILHSESTLLHPETATLPAESLYALLLILHLCLVFGMQEELTTWRASMKVLLGNLSFIAAIICVMKSAIIS